MPSLLSLDLPALVQVSLSVKESAFWPFFLCHPIFLPAFAASYIGRAPPKEFGLDPGNVKAAAAVTLEGCLSLHKKALSRVMPLGLVYGNASLDDAKKMWKKVRRSAGRGSRVTAGRVKRDGHVTSSLFVARSASCCFGLLSRPNNMEKDIGFAPPTLRQSHTSFAGRNV